MKIFRTIMLPLALVFSLSASAFVIHNDTTENIRFRVHGPAIANYYGKVSPGQSVNRAAPRHVRIYVYFRRAYDWMNPFPGGTLISPSRDVICPELANNGVHKDAIIHVAPNGAFYQCRVSMPSTTQ